MEPKILVLLPFAAEGREFMEYNYKYVFPGYADIKGLPFGRRMNESPADSAITVYEELKAIVQAQRDGYDAVVVGCFLDPGVREAREVVDIPVFGVANVSLNVCAMLGHRTGVLTTSIFIKRGIESNLRECGLNERTTVRCINTNVEELLNSSDEKDRAVLLKALADEAERLIVDDDAAVLTLGCGGLYGYLDELKALIRKRGYDVPFVESHRTAVEVVRSLIRFGYRQSRLTYPRLGDYEGLDI